MEEANQILIAVCRNENASHLGCYISRVNLFYLNSIVMYDFMYEVDLTCNLEWVEYRGGVMIIEVE